LLASIDSRELTEWQALYMIEADERREENERMQKGGSGEDQLRKVFGRKE
jgi:hypothetical protein